MAAPTTPNGAYTTSPNIWVRELQDWMRDHRSDGPNPNADPHANYAFRRVADVKTFGATGDNTTDDTAAIQAANDSIDNTQGGFVFFPKGTYRTTATITAGEGIVFVGESRAASRIKADHSAGPVLRFKKSYSGCQNLAVWATTARKTGGAGSNYGIQFECDDIPEDGTTRMRNSFVTDCRVFDQPNHGIVLVGPGLDGSQVARCYVQGNLGHGIVVDRGTTTGRVNLATTGVAGLTRITDTAVASNGGHGVAIGHPGDTGTLPAVRVIADNLDVAGNSTDATVRHTAQQVYIRGANCEVRASGINGGSTTGGIFVAGKNHWFRNNRYISCVSSVHVGVDPAVTTEGINVEGLSVISLAQNPAVVIDNGARNVRILNWLPSNVTTLHTGSRPGVEVVRVPQIVQKTSDEVINNDAVLHNDNALSFWLDASEKVAFQCVIEHLSANVGSDLQVAFTVPAGGTLRWAPVGSIKIDAADAIVVQPEIAASGTAVTFGSAGSRRHIVIEGTVHNGATEGLVRLQWAQAVATAANTTVYAVGSNLRVWRKY